MLGHKQSRESASPSRELLLLIFLLLLPRAVAGGAQCSAMARVVGILLAVVAAAAASLLAPVAAELTRVEHPPKTEGSLNILAVGDWGRRGQYNQTLVAEQVTHTKKNCYSIHSLISNSIKLAR